MPLHLLGHQRFLDEECEEIAVEYARSVALNCRWCSSMVSLCLESIPVKTLATLANVVRSFGRLLLDTWAKAICYTSSTFHRLDTRG